MLLFSDSFQMLKVVLENFNFHRTSNSEWYQSTSRLSGGNSEKVTPVPIPNTVVKLLSADNTWWATAREHKTSPERLTLDEISHRGFLFFTVVLEND